MREINLSAQLHEGAVVWFATASKDGAAEYDSGPGFPKTALDALMLLAQELYETVDRLNRTPAEDSSSQLPSWVALKCATLGGHNYGQDGVCIRPGCNDKSNAPFRVTPRIRGGETDADGR